MPLHEMLFGPVPKRDVATPTEEELALGRAVAEREGGLRLKGLVDPETYRTANFARMLRNWLRPSNKQMYD